MAKCKPKRSVVWPAMPDLVVADFACAAILPPQQFPSSPSLVPQWKSVSSCVPVLPASRPLVS